MAALRTSVCLSVLASALVAGKPARGAPIAPAPAPLSSEPAPAPREGRLLAADGERSFRQAYEAGDRPGRRTPHYLRAALEEAVVLGIGTAYYWVRPEINQTDWDFPDYATRMENLRPTFDTNLHVTNDVLHPLAGSFYYGFARLNGLSVPTALGYSILTSATFEFFLEWLEKASVNDLIMTPMGGLAPGEFFVHLGEYANSAPQRTWLRAAAGWTLGLPHNLLHERPTSELASALPPDALGFSSYYAHRFTALLGVARVFDGGASSVQESEARLEADLVAMPGFLRPGRFSGAFHDGNFTKARVRGALGDHLSVDLFFDAALAGRYAQHVAVIDGARRGRASMVAVDSSFRFVERRSADRYDAYAMAHLVGPSFALWAVRGDLVASVEGATHPDFAAIHSPAFESWRAQHGDDGVKSSLQQKGFYYGYGWSGRLEGQVSYRGFEVGSRGFFGAYGSIDRWDRFQDRVTRDLHGTDQIAELEAWLGWSSAQSPIHARLFAFRSARLSQLEAVREASAERRFGALLGARF